MTEPKIDKENDVSKYADLGQLARNTWDTFGGRALGAHTEYEREAFEEVAKAVVKAAGEAGITWSEDDDD